MQLYDQVLHILKKLEVDHIYGVPGDAINPLVEAVRKDEDIRFIHVTHEESGAFAASAEAKLTGKLAVCAGTVGPGAIHLMNGLYDAHKDNAPVLALTGQVDRKYMGSGYHQEVDLHTLFKDVSVYNATLSSPAQMPHIVLEACNTALNRGGPAVLTVHHDVAGMSVDEVGVVADLDAGDSRLLPASSRLQKAADKINNAEKVAILAGKGCREARKALLKMAETLNAPVIHSLKGKGLVPHNNTYYAGGLGLLGTRGGVKATKECDLLLVAGSDFPYREWYPESTPIVRIDRRPERFGRRNASTYGLNGDCGPTLSALMKLLRPKTDTSFLHTVQKARDRWNKLMDRAASTGRSKHIIHPQAVARLVSTHARQDAVFSCDTGEVTVWAARYLHLQPDQHLIMSYNLASMAFALPGAIAAQLAYPKRQVISLSGDGGFNMLMGDLLTAVKYELPLKIILFNNQKLGLIKMEQEVEGYPESETDLLNPNYPALAKSFGADGKSIREPGKLDKAVQTALESEGPYLLDVHIHPDELTLPPKIQANQALGYGLSKIREVLAENGLKDLT